LPEFNAALERLEDQELIVRRAASRFEREVEYTFRHALVHEAAYGLMADDDQALAHAHMAAWLERAGELDAAVLAEHFERGRDLARAAVWFRRAAELSLEANDFTTAIERAKRCEECGAAGKARPRMAWAACRRAELDLRRVEGDRASRPPERERSRARLSHSSLKALL
jgi:predicted ATPase